MTSITDTSPLRCAMCDPWGRFWGVAWLAPGNIGFSKKQSLSANCGQLEDGGVDQGPARLRTVGPGSPRGGGPPAASQGTTTGGMKAGLCFGLWRTHTTLVLGEGWWQVTVRGGEGGSSLQKSASRDHGSFCDDRAKKGKKKKSVRIREAEMRAELIRQSSKFARYQNKLQKSVVFFHTSSHQFANIIKNKTPRKIANYSLSRRCHVTCFEITKGKCNIINKEGTNDWSKLHDIWYGSTQKWCQSPRI